MDYINIDVLLPKGLQASIENSAIQIVGHLGDDECGFTVNSCQVPSPIIRTASFLLDIDIYRCANLPQENEEIWALLDRIRDQKNRIFEDCITDKSRELFNQ